MSRKQLFLTPLVVLMALLATGPVLAQTTVPVTAELNAAGGELTVGDPVELTLSVTHPADHEVILPQLEDTWGDFVVQSQSAPTTVTNQDGTETTSQVIDVRLFASGVFETPPLAIAVTDSTGQISEVIAQPTPITITSVLVEGDTEMRDIKPQADLPYANLLPWIVGGLLLTAAAMVVILLRRRHRARLALSAVDSRLPHEIALDDLAHIESLELPRQGRFKEHYTLVSDCIRLYVEGIYSLPVTERTTDEIGADLKDSRVEPDVARQFLGLLDISDLVKFSKFRPDADSAYRLLAHARHIVEATRPIILGPEQQPETNGSQTGTGSPVEVTSVSGVATNGKYRHTEVSA